MSETSTKNGANQKWSQHGGQNGIKIDKTWYPEAFQKLVKKACPKKYYKTTPKNCQKKMPGKTAWHSFIY